MKRSLMSLMVALALCAGACAKDDSNWAYGIANELLSPYCPGRTLAECPSPQAGELRAWISVQAAAGRTREDVVEELYERFGDQIRPTPKVEGFGVTAYALPIVAFLLGGVLVVVALRRMTGGGPLDTPESQSVGGGSPPARSPEDSELERIVDEELRG